ncbi:hypothetical protein KAFR_0B04630 [Kazachstania africana CBS 2517]|uniref:Protein kinase domain-containing protein n=1 Tax=Kazachstania africana (strain ATCC 22294 / BCRC 22015 / CBS 2517 / CECT 1963 / NBRC 1671 / NRRL Y-8276) TaxID=1071382 RepID=H2AQW0_KAZAF|nr:hypothetical protein KAFR_0B04630 [Kazachstania africana CBS 2517]CCF56760.1 hypothetical protein KAFR_0B04630 [Kazachstania africana CBS 2517]
MILQHKLQLSQSRTSVPDHNKRFLRSSLQELNSFKVINETNNYLEDSDSNLSSSKEDSLFLNQIDSELEKYITSESSASAPSIKTNYINFEPKPYPIFQEQNELKDFILIKEVGQGAFSKVFLAVPDPNGSKSFLINEHPQVAIKVAKKNNKERERNKTGKEFKVSAREDVINEVSIQKSVSGLCSNIAQYFDFQESDNFFFIIQEYIAGGEIFNQIIKYTYFSEDLCRHIITQVAHALKVLHSHEIVHRDIKPENLLYTSIPIIKEKERHLRKSDDQNTKISEGRFIKHVGAAEIGEVKLVDFGLSKQLVNKGTKTPCGTLCYVAPEIINHHRYSKKVDMWGVGCVLYTMLCGFPPFFDDDSEQLKEKICNGDYAFLEPWWNEISIEAKYCVTRLLEVDAKKRYSVDDFLNDPWLNSYDCDKVTNKKVERVSISKYGKPEISEREIFFREVFSRSNTILRNKEKLKLPELPNNTTNNLIPPHFSLMSDYSILDLELQNPNLYNCFKKNPSR